MVPGATNDQNECKKNPLEKLREKNTIYVIISAIKNYWQHLLIKTLTDAKRRNKSLSNDAKNIKIAQILIDFPFFCSKTPDTKTPRKLFGVLV